MDIRFSVACVLLLVYLSSINAKYAHRSKRNLQQLEKLIRCESGRKAEDYINYGCWCGLGGGGQDPVDKVDECCKGHDGCYDGLIDDHKCKGLDLYMKPYYLPARYGEGSACPKLDGHHCDKLPKGGKCITGLCKCDLQFVDCLRALRGTPFSYDENYANYVVGGCSFKKFVDQLKDLIRRAWSNQ